MTEILTCYEHDTPWLYAADTECTLCRSERLVLKECGQHRALVRYSGDTCPMCRAIDLLIEAQDKLDSYILQTDERCGANGCHCTWPDVRDCSQHIQDLRAEIGEFVS